MDASFLQQSIRRLAPDRRIYAVGDIHGMAQLLADVFARIDADLAQRPRQHATEVFLGDFIDRGPESARVLSMLIERTRTRDCALVVGNHELAMVRAMLSDASVEPWLRLGGRETMMSYGVVPPPVLPAPDSMRAFRASFASRHAELPRLWRPYHRIGDFVFVHGGVRPGVPLEQQSLTDLTGIRSEFLNSEAPHGFVVVHGHTPRAAPEFRANRINLDTQAYLTGKLSCLAIDCEGLRLI
jgi:serine/threonine protein phosphatase 1